MKIQDLWGEYYSFVEELREREKRLMALRRKKIEILERMDEIREKSKHQIIQRLKKEIREKEILNKNIKEDIKKQKTIKLKLEKDVRDLEKQMQ